jgi:hypothetical protein
MKELIKEKKTTYLNFMLKPETIPITYDSASSNKYHFYKKKSKTISIANYIIPV